MARLGRLEDLHTGAMPEATLLVLLHSPEFYKMVGRPKAKRCLEWCRTGTMNGRCGEALRLISLMRPQACEVLAVLFNTRSFYEFAGLMKGPRDSDWRHVMARRRCILARLFIALCADPGYSCATLVDI